MFKTRVNRLMVAALMAALVFSLTGWFQDAAVAQEKARRFGGGQGHPGNDFINDDFDRDEGSEVGNFEWGYEHNLWKIKMEEARLAYMASFTRFCWMPPMFFMPKLAAYMHFIRDYVHYLIMQRGFDRIWCTLSGSVFESVEMGRGMFKRFGKVPIAGARITIYRKVLSRDPSTPVFTKMVAITVSNARQRRNYIIEGLKRGHYAMKVTSLGYDDYFDPELRLKRRRVKKNVKLNAELLPARLSGTVRHLQNYDDYELVLPLPGVEVILEIDTGPLGGEIISLVALTDADGRFVFDGLPAGEAVLTVFHPGYTEYEEVLFIQDGCHYERDEIMLYSIEQPEPVAGCTSEIELGGLIDPSDTIDGAFDQHPKKFGKVSLRR
ncbi:MAG: carboxypeptidase-like regulatory domain-containing protein [bacterium]|nr:carboxypeptidase-like regulatory domain-containing protein [bacterium]